MGKFSIDPTQILGSGLFALIIAGTVMITTSGCRVGNYVEKQELGDRWTGKYNTSPTAVTLTAVVDGKPRSKAIPLTQVPAELAAYMSDPVILYIDPRDLNDRIGNFYHKDGTGSGLPIMIGEDGVELWYSGSSSPDTLWKAYHRCTEQLNILENGRIARPRIEVDTTIYRDFDGPECTAALTDMMNCYNDIDHCDGVPSSAAVYQSKIISVFGKYFDNGVFSADEMPLVRNIGYAVSYR